MSSLFGRTYSDVGSTSSDLILKTRGQVKILFGGKFIDLIKDGKLNVDAKFVHTGNSVGSKDGIYLVNGEVILVAGGTEIPLGLEGTTYVSFLKELKVDRESKVKALTNIGFIYNSLEDVTEVDNGIVYIQNLNKLYLITNGVATEFSAVIPNPVTQQFVIEKNDDTVGALVIKGSGEKNGISFDSMSIYSEAIKIDLKLSIILGVLELVTIDGNDLSSQVPIRSNRILSLNNSFQLFSENGLSTLMVDQIISQSLIDLQENLKLGMDTFVSPKRWYYNNNVIHKVVSIDRHEPTDEDPNNYTNAEVSLLFNNEFVVGDVLVVFVSTDNTLTEVSFTITGIDLSNITIHCDSLIPNDVTLLNKVLYLVGNSAQLYYLPRIDLNGFHLIDSLKPDSPVVSITKDGIKSKSAEFEEAKYKEGYQLPESDNSTSFPSTEWVRKLLLSLLPIGSIIMYNGSTIPKGWALCDGSTVNDTATPNLVGKFIKAGITPGLEGGSNLVTLSIDNLPSHSHTVPELTITTSEDGLHSHTYSLAKEPDTGYLDTGDKTVLNELINGTSEESGSHTHEVIVESSETNSVGNGQAITIEPLYYTLVFIMRVS